jgi:hypothetical protein
MTTRSVSRGAACGSTGLSSGSRVEIIRQQVQIACSSIPKWSLKEAHLQVIPYAYVLVDCLRIHTCPLFFPTTVMTMIPISICPCAPYAVQVFLPLSNFDFIERLYHH